MCAFVFVKTSLVSVMCMCEGARCMCACFSVCRAGVCECVCAHFPPILGESATFTSIHTCNKTDKQLS